MPTPAYDEDLYAWAMHTAGLVRQGQFAAVDTENLAEELEAMGKKEQRALESRLVVLLAHLLKWDFLPAGRSKSWERTLLEQRKRVRRLLADSPSLRPKLAAALADAYDSALRWAAEETGLDESDFPPRCPWDLDAVLDGAGDPPGTLPEAH